MEATIAFRTDERTRKKNKRIAYLKRTYPLYIMLLPMVVYLLIFSYYPLMGIILAFKDWTIKGGIWGSPWATNENGEIDLFIHFKTLFSDPDFKTKLINTLRISGLRLLFGFPVPIIITILLNEMPSRKICKGFQMVSYLPHFISWVIIAGILTTMTASKTGFQNFMTALFGHEVSFFTDDHLFLTMVVISDIWKEAGWGTIIYFAAISGISQDLYEAAEMDGANRWQRMKYITLPGLVPAISINLILAASGIIYGGFDQVFNLYNQTVYEMGDILDTYLYRIGISSGSYDVATAIGLFDSTISLILIIIANKLIKRIGGEGIW
jgi:putative aldouronate transport system permease protein